MGTPANPVTDAERARIVQLARDGTACRAIARDVRRSASTVSRIVRDAGVEFHNVRAASATNGRIATAKAVRAELAIEALQHARRFLRQLDEPHTVFNIGGRDNTYTEHEMPKPPTGDIRNLMQSFAIAVEKSLRLTDYDTGDGSSEVASLLGRLFDGLQASHGDGSGDAG